MIFPTSTYRIQLSEDFNFEDLQEIVEYLENFGISTIYAAPFFKARKGSTHGYDVLDPFTLNPEIGKLETFRQISDDLQQKRMGWLQDIVPNHMAFDGNNPWLRDIFELGPHSRFYNFFDIDWDYKDWKKVMAPFLGNPFDEVLKNAEIKLQFDQRGFSVNYFDHSYPCSARSYPVILEETEVGKFSERFANFSGNDTSWEDLKVAFYREVQDNAQLKNKISSIVEEINRSEEKIRNILDLQYFKLTHWKQTEKEINYRRFFTINDLICLRMEDPQVFETYHHFIKEMCDEKMINGLRIDHIDGLFDPAGYTEKLKKLIGEDFFIVVEKILEREEKLPVKWPVQGTSGYDFLAVVNHLFIEAKNETEFSEIYKKIYPEIPDYEDLVYQKKLFILKERMGGELHNLWDFLKEKNLLPEGQIQEKEKWQEALSAFLAAFPVYRVYPRAFPLSQHQQKIIEIAHKKAIKKLPEGKEELDYLSSLYNGKAGKDEEKVLYFLQRCQQFSGPLAAKGVEDTSFYIYNRLISNNEVGDSPETFGISIESFHQKMHQKQQDFPNSVNATATHDTKRGEDARMRLNVLSEIPQEWFSKVQEWKEISNKIRKDKNSPDKNEEYFIYQALLGAMPFKGFREENFLQRTKDYLQKVMREAKINTNWAEPDEAHENAVFEFIEQLLEDTQFKDSFIPFCQKIASYGVVKSLGQSLAKITAPGIPDIYQGSELWNLSYVDPDNRRPVDYELRKRYMSEFNSLDKDPENQLQSLLQNFSNGKVKMYCLYKALTERRRHSEVFQKGEYLPLSVSGDLSEKIIAYARREKEKYFIIVVPVLVTELFSKQELLPDPNVLNEVSVSLPENAPKKWKNVFTHQSMKAEGKIALKGLFKNFPVALLTNI